MPVIEVSDQLYGQLQQTDGPEDAEEAIWRLVYESRQCTE